VSQALDSMVVQVTASEGNGAAFMRGQMVAIKVTPTTPVALLGNPNATIASIRPGMVLTMWGLSDRTGHVMLIPHDIMHLLPNTAAILSKAAPKDDSAV
jgi:hypothetical protein